MKETIKKVKEVLTKKEPKKEEPKKEEVKVDPDLPESRQRWLR